MKQFQDSNTIQEYLHSLQKKQNEIGFVPTMGALHQGHLSLIEKAKAENDFVVCSIFVNPLQFNRIEDLKSYPDRREEDIKMLESVNCDILFFPSKADLYQQDPTLDYNFGSLAKGMEADYRPGHFQGVAAVIDRFFSLLHPDRAYFGEKDYQQLAIVKWLAKEKNYGTKVVGCETVRFKNGLAMSSRNYNLADDEFEKAALIYQLMNYCKDHKQQYTPKQLCTYCLAQLAKDFQAEYFTIVDGKTLEPISKWSDSDCPRVFVAAYLGTVRLIDNMSLID
jgi:pantoate--beta-alanine ligase